MSVQIEVDMPKSCDKCPFGRYVGVMDGKYHSYACRILDRTIAINSEICNKFESCPLKEVNND